MKSIWELGINDMISPAVKKVQATALRAFAQLDGDQIRLQKSVNANADTFKRQQATISNVGGAIKDALGVGGVLDTVKSLGTSIFEIGSNMEQSRTAFTVLLGDADLAKNKLAELQKFADVSPFNTSEVFDAGQKLLGYKVAQEKLLPVMNMLGDVSQGQSDKFSGLVENYGKMVTAQRANTEDLNQFANAGVPVWDELGKLLGKNGEALRDYVEKNGVSVAQIDTVLGNLTKEGGMFFGMMDKQSQTTAGRFSTLSSQLEQVAVKIYDALQPAMNALIDLGSKVLPVLEGALGTVYHAGMDVIDFFQQHEGITTVLVGAAGAVAGLALAYVGLQGYLLAQKGILAVLSAVETAHFIALELLDGATLQATLTAAGFNAVLLANPITWVIVAVGALVGAFLYAMEHFEGFRKTMYGLWEACKQVFTNIGAFFAKIFEPISEGLDAFARKDYGGMALAVGKMAYNLATLPAQAVEFAVDGNLTKGVADDFHKGYGAEAQRIFNKKADLPAGVAGPEGSDNGFSMVLTPEQQKELKKPASPMPFATHAGTPTAVPGNNTGSPSTGNGGSSSTGGGKNIIINIQNLVGEVKFVGDLKTNIPNAKAQLKEALLSVVNDTQLDMA